jgi:cyclase
MLKKRIIPCLDIQHNRVVKGIHFENIRDAGNPVELARYYTDAGADELVFLDITATAERRKPITNLISAIAAVINIPFTVGGGIRSIEDVTAIIQAGSDKISLNSAAVQNPSLITSIAGTYGTQCVIVAIDAKWLDNQWKVMINGGKTSTHLSVIEWAQKVQALGAGEILLTSMDHDGAKNGYDIDLINAVNAVVNIPVIASGGAGTPEHFMDLFTKSRASGALAASIFHFGEIAITDLKNNLRRQNIPIRCN